MGGYPGQLEGPDSAGPWNSHGVRFRPQGRVRRLGGVLALTEIAGRAEVWLDGAKVAEKTGFAPGPLEIPLPPGEAERELVVIVEGEKGRPSGLGKPVAVRERR